jgi:radical SAM protein with 4Fe4S-binding SPASM domain
LSAAWHDGAVQPRRLDVLHERFRPVYVVWELTLRCDQPCTHCGSRAGEARARELSTAQALDVVRQLAAMGTREVVLIGGEAYLHPGVHEVLSALRDAGVVPTMTTGGRGIDRALARSLADAGLSHASVSLDGIGATHDRLRASPGSFAAATAALSHLAEAGVRCAANTNVNRYNQGDLEPLYEFLRAPSPEGGRGPIESWQVQLTVPLGRAADRPELLLQPWELLHVVPHIAALKRRAQADGILLMPGNNLGYFGPEEGLMRSIEPGGGDHWRGCQAGRFVMGIESDGAVKGCPSLQTSHYVGGRLTNGADGTEAGARLGEHELAAIWDGSPELAFARARGVEALWGYCHSCPFADTCLGGCSFTAHAIFGRPGNNPYCHYRARALAREGKRERLVRVAKAPGAPFDHALFEVVVEALDAPEPPAPTPRERLLKIVP